MTGGVRGVRLLLVLVGAEAVGYFVGFLLAAARLGQGGAADVRSVTTTLLGLTVFRGARHGDVTTISSAAWLLPALIALPVLVWLVVAGLPRLVRFCAGLVA